MKLNKMRLIIIFYLLFGHFLAARAQSTEVQQLLLNVEKLSQMKNILSDMKKGYEIVSGGYQTVKNIAQGNFSLHEVFLDAMMLVSPEVKKYRKVSAIIAYQSDLVSEYKSAFKRFKTSDLFSITELDYLGRVYAELFKQSLENLDQLAMVITAGKLRMSDDERLKSIDRIYAEVEDKLVFLRDFNAKAASLCLARENQRTDLKHRANFYP
ncbi:TerB family tellurite resistance protein [Pedobacter sp. GR22-6]|uniref:TerB family tellurite resistance protein n=1 Tax=Pedobacter sp. GR22-6 TaxID=3127957 RepID=UPI00307DD4DF